MELHDDVLEDDEGGDRFEFERDRPMGLQRTTESERVCFEREVGEILDPDGTEAHQSNYETRTNHPSEKPAGLPQETFDSLASSQTEQNSAVPTVPARFQNHVSRDQSNESGEMGETRVEDLSTQGVSNPIQHELMDPEGSQRIHQEGFNESFQDGEHERFKNDQALPVAQEVLETEEEEFPSNLSAAPKSHPRVHTPGSFPGNGGSRGDVGNDIGTATGVHSFFIGDSRAQIE